MDYSISLGSLPHADPFHMIHMKELQEHLDIIQICPQNCCIVTKEFITKIKEKKPDSEIRLHANVTLFNINESKRMFKIPTTFADASMLHRGFFAPYWSKLADILSFNGSPYTIHAGKRKNCSLDKMIDNIKIFEQRSSVHVGVEGMYPTQTSLKSNELGYLMDNLSEYRKVMESGIKYAIDLSHLNIIKHQDKYFDIYLVKDLLDHDNCIEIHISDNNGNSDSHHIIKEELWWHLLLDKVNAPIISEENLNWKIKGNNK